MSVLHLTLKAAAFGSVITEISHNSQPTDRQRRERETSTSSGPKEALTLGNILFAQSFRPPFCQIVHLNSPLAPWLLRPDLSGFFTVPVGEEILESFIVTATTLVITEAKFECVIFVKIDL